jgi:hypothetical protein
MDSFQFLLILRIALVSILYLVIMQIVLVARRDFRRAAVAPVAATTRARDVIGHLVVIDSGSTALRPGQEVDLEPITTIGRAPTNSIVLDTNFVSTEHARIIFKDRSLWVEDMDSRNGTYLDQKKLNQPVAVAPGAILQIGDVRFKFAV